MRFEFATAGRVIFGPGTLDEAAPLVRAWGGRVLIVTGRTTARAQPLVERFKATGLEWETVAIPHEPTTDDITAGVTRARESRCEAVVGFGGGAALDAAKAIAALLTHGGDLLDYLEVIGRAQPIERPSAPCLVLPTTAGTGAEVTRNAVLASPAHRVKVSLRGAPLLPRVAIVDPALTHGLPPEITAATGLDALTQLIEPYVSARANPLTDALCVEGIRRVARSLRRACEQGSDAAAREDMSLASLFSGFALANAGLGAVHGFAGPVGGMFPAPHGAVCAALLPHAMEMNLAALRARAPGHPSISRFDEIGRLLTGDAHATAADGVRWVRELVTGLRIPGLAAYGLTPADHATVVAAAARASSMKANPIVLTNDELTTMLARAA